MNIKNNEEKLEELRARYNREPDSIEAALALAQFYADLGWLNEAQQLYKSLLSVNQKDFALLLEYGNICFKKQEYKEAISVFKDLTVMNPARIEGWNNLGIVYLTCENIDGAAAAFSRVLEIEPDNAGALLNRGNCHFEKNELNIAHQYFERSVKAAPDFADGWFNLGNTFLAREEYDDAIHAYQRALRFRYDFVSALKNLGYVYQKKGSFDLARDQYLQALQFNKADASIYRNLAIVYTSIKNFDEAKECFLRAVRLAPRNLGGWMGLRHLSLVKGDLETYMRATTAVLPRLAGDVIAASARALRELGHWDMTAKIITQADSLNKESVLLDIERLLLYSNRKINTHRIPALEKKIQNLNSPPSEVKLGFATYLFQNKKPALAEKCLNGMPADQLSYRTLQWRVLIAQRKFDAAKEDITVFLKDHSDCFDGWFLLAGILIEQDDIEQARAMLIKALENGFNDIEAIQGNKKLKLLYQALAVSDTVT